MYLCVFLTLVSVITTSLAAPATSKSVTFVDTYDTLDPGIPAFPLNNPVSLYNGLLYTDWLVGGPSPLAPNDAHGGVIPVSPPNEAIAVPLSLNLTLPSMTVKYNGSKYEFFDLTSFYFACDLYTNQGVASVAQGCVISVVGYYSSGAQTGVATYGYSASDPLQSPMFKAVLPSSFKGLQTVMFGVASSASTLLTTTLLIDNVTHTNWKY